MYQIHVSDTSDFVWLWIESQFNPQPKEVLDTSDFTAHCKKMALHAFSARAGNFFVQQTKPIDQQAFRNTKNHIMFR